MSKKIIKYLKWAIILAGMILFNYLQLRPIS